MKTYSEDTKESEEGSFVLVEKIENLDPKKNKEKESCRFRQLSKLRKEKEKKERKKERH